MKKVQESVQQIAKSKNVTKAEKDRFRTAGAQVARYQDTAGQIAAMDVATASMLMSQADDDPVCVLTVKPVSQSRALTAF